MLRYQLAWRDLMNKYLFLSPKMIFFFKKNSVIKPVLKSRIQEGSFCLLKYTWLKINDFRLLFEVNKINGD